MVGNAHPTVFSLGSSHILGEIYVRLEASPTG